MNEPTTREREFNGETDNIKSEMNENTVLRPRGGKFGTVYR